MTHRLISLSSPDIGEEERELVEEVLRGRTLSFGPKLEEFEALFAARFNVRHAVAVSSGTAGLHLAMIAAGISDGDFVVTSPFSFVASANVILYERGVPIFVDIDRDTLMPNSHAVLEVAQRLREKGLGWKQLLPREGATGSGSLRAILPVHVFGQPAEVANLVDAADTLQIAVVEDACEAIGARGDGHPVGTNGTAGVFAFYPNKQMTTGEGGMIVTNRDDWAALTRSLRNQGRDDSAFELRHTRLGYNYRLDEMSAALGLAQLRRLDDLLAKRSAVATGYTQRLSGVEGVSILQSPRKGMEQSWFVFVVRLDADVDREQLMTKLEAAGVPTRPYFSPIHLQPLYIELFGYRPGDFPNAEEAGRTMLALPFHPGLDASDLDYVVDQLRRELPVARRRSVQIAVESAPHEQAISTSQANDHG